MADEPSGKPELVKPYYVLDPDMASGFDVGGHPIKREREHFIVLMLPSQAQYYLDNGALSDKPGKPEPVHALGHGKPDEILEKFKQGGGGGRATPEKPDWRRAPRQVSGDAEAPPTVHTRPKK